MAVITMKQLLDAGVHFGHQTRRWNPKMKRFIHGERNGIYILDLNQTLSRLEDAYVYTRDLVAGGGTILFVGTKRQAQDSIQSYAEKCGMPYVNQRWLGGMLTNFQTIQKRVDKMKEYRRMRDSGEFDAMPKKEALRLSRELEKLERNLGGISQLTKAPNAVFVLDTKLEHTAVTEANKLGLPLVAVVDTNCDPDLVDFVIPGNDDAIRAGDLMCRVIADAVMEGHFIRAKKAEATGAPVAEGGVSERSDAEQAEVDAAQAQAREAAAAEAAARDARLSALAAEADADAATEDAAPAAEESPAEPAAEETPAEESAPAEASTEDSAGDEATDKTPAAMEEPPASAEDAGPSESSDAEEAAESSDAEEAAESSDAEEAAEETAKDFGEGSAAANADGSMPEGFPIKGNADSMKFHQPDGRWYEGTVAEVWFATAEAATAAGFTEAGK